MLLASLQPLGGMVWLFIHNFSFFFFRNRHDDGNKLKLQNDVMDHESR